MSSERGSPRLTVDDSRVFTYYNNGETFLVRHSSSRPETALTKPNKSNT